MPYTAGRGLDIGCGRERLFDTEFCIGVDNGQGDGSGAPIQANIKLDARDLSSLASGQQDYVFSSFLLQNFPYKEVPAVLREWMRLLKPFGCLVLYLPDAEAYPKVAEDGAPAEPGANGEQKWNVTYEKLVTALRQVAFNWDLCAFEHCGSDDEYALFAAIRRLK